MANVMSEVFRDVRHAVRQWRTAPAFAVFSLGVLGVGIGGTLALFALFDTIALRSLPIPAPDRLAALRVVSPATRTAVGSVSRAALREIARRQTVFSAMTAYTAGGVSTFADGRPIEHGAAFVSEEYFDTFGVLPGIGRLLSGADATAQVVVISDGYWQRAYDRDRTIVGRTVRIEDRPFTIVGVASRGFVGLEPHAAVDFFLPVAIGSSLFPLPENSEIEFTRAIGRLKDGVSLAEARREIAGLWPGVREDITPTNTTPAERTEFLSRQIEVSPAARGFSHMRDWYESPLRVLIASTTCLLLVICVNLAGLMWTRTMTRQREVQVRIALGAPPWRVTRQLLVESLLLTTAGTAIAIPIASFSSHALVLMMWNEPTVAPVDLTPGWRLYLAAGLCALGTGLALGFLPAWRIGRGDRTGGHCASSMSGRISHATGDILVVAQVALAIVLLASAGLVTQSLVALRDHRAGFPTGGIQIAALLPKGRVYEGRDIDQHLRTLVDRASAVPGITGAALSVPELLMGIEAGEERLSVSVAGVPDHTYLEATTVRISPGFFDVLGMPLLGGRDISWNDDTRTPVVALLSAGLAARLFPDGDPVSRRIRLGFSPRHESVEIVGITADARLADLHADDPLFVFLSIVQHPDTSPSVVVRSNRPAAAIGPELRSTLEAAGRDFVFAHRTLDNQIAISLLRERLMALGGRWFAALALVLIVAGIAGLLSQLVVRRTREIGIRVALGAPRRSILALVVGRMLVLTGLGIVIGLPLAGISTHLLVDQLSGVSPTDTAIFVATPVLVLVVALAAAWVPMRRATSIAPADALKSE